MEAELLIDIVNQNNEHSICQLNLADHNLAAASDLEEYIKATSSSFLRPDGQDGADPIALSFLDYADGPAVTGSTQLPVQLLPAFVSVRPTAFLLSLSYSASDSSGYTWLTTSRWSSQKNYNLSHDALLLPVQALQQLNKHAVQPLRCTPNTASANGVVAPQPSSSYSLQINKKGEQATQPLNITISSNATLWDLKLAISDKTSCKAETLSIYHGKMQLQEDFQPLCNFSCFACPPSASDPSEASTSPKEPGPIPLTFACR